MKIDLNVDAPSVFSGRERARLARIKFNLDVLDASDEIIEVTFPADVYTVTSSYFLGLFGQSVRTLGRERFLGKYLFIAPDRVKRKIDDWIARALREKKDLFGGALG